MRSNVNLLGSAENRWLSRGIPVSSTDKTVRHDIFNIADSHVFVNQICFPHLLYESLKPAVYIQSDVVSFRLQQL